MRQPSPNTKLIEKYTDDILIYYDSQKGRFMVWYAGKPQIRRTLRAAKLAANKIMKEVSDGNSRVFS